MQFLPRIDYFIDREHLDTFVSDGLEPVKVIMNGWYMNNKWNWPPSPVIVPLLISMHFQREDLLGINDSFLLGIGGEYFRKQEIVGCRDTETQKFLQENGIATEFSGCLTLTLKDKFTRKVDKPYCCITNCSNEVVNYVKEKRPDLVIKVFSQEPAVDQSAAWNERFNNVEKLLQEYQNAEFVITTKLHCAMPCLALKTPVLFLDEDTIIENDRFSGLSDLLYCETKNDFLEGKGDFKLDNPPENTNDYLALRKSLIKKCKQFVELETTCNFEKEYFWNKYKENAEWKEEMLIQVQKKIFKQYNNLYEGKKWIEEQWKNQKDRINELEKWCHELEDGKRWIEEQWENQKVKINKLEQNNDELKSQIEIEKEKKHAFDKEVALLKKSKFVNWLIKKNNLSL